MTDAEFISKAAYEFVNIVAEYAVKADPNATLVEIGGLSHQNVANVIRTESKKIYDGLPKDSSTQPSNPRAEDKPN